MEALGVCAVLTGDVVASQSLSRESLDRVRSVIFESSQQLASWSEGLVPRPLEFSRGDTWQLLLRDPSQALRASLWIRSELLHRCAVDTRIAVGLGAVLPLADTLAKSGGPAFVLSGQALDEMAARRLTIVLPPLMPLAVWADLSARLCDALVASWTQRQAQLVHAVLSPQAGTQSAIAAQLVPAVTKQAVGKGLRAAQWAALSCALKVFEENDWSLLFAESIDNQ